MDRSVSHFCRAANVVTASEVREPERVVLPLWFDDLRTSVERLVGEKATRSSSCAIVFLRGCLLLGSVFEQLLAFLDAPEALEAYPHFLNFVPPEWSRDRLLLDNHREFVDASVLTEHFNGPDAINRLCGLVVGDAREYMQAFGEC